MIWCCSLNELARISLSKEEVYFEKEKKNPYITVFSEAFKNEKFIQTYILDELCSSTAIYYQEVN